MNILTTNGLVGRYVTDWAGPNALLKSVSIRLGAPNYPGDTMTITGAVTKKDDGEIEVGPEGLQPARRPRDRHRGARAAGEPTEPINWKADKKSAKKQDKKRRRPRRRTSEEVRRRVKK